jgi:hypothetical protein
VKHLVEDYFSVDDKDMRSCVIDKAVEELNVAEYEQFLKQVYLTRKLNPTQSRKIRSLCQKLEYYSAVRKFQSKKSGNYSFKVSFLTLTAPDSATHTQMLSAFDHFLDYLRRTANCVYVWKKEIGESGGNLHFHLMINNFIPYYIVEWKWRRLLINEGVSWPVNNKGEPTKSHYRIELPRSKRKIGHYISKYMSKAYAMPKKDGYISGHSAILDELEEIKIIESDLPYEEINVIMSSHKVIRSEYVTHVCCDLLRVKNIAPRIGAIFEAQYIRFCEAITLPQRFHVC